MMIFEPGHNDNIINYHFVDGLFSDVELDTLKAQLRDLSLTEGQIGEGEVDPYTRRSKVSFLPPADLGADVCKKMLDAIKDMNKDVFNFDLTGLLESLQYTTYDEEYRGMYNWHFDEGSGEDKTWTRKLSVILILSDPIEYGGGDLEMVTEKGIDAVEQKRGRLVIFPSFLRHRVRPITKGSRESLVFWVSGPAFR